MLQTSITTNIALFFFCWFFSTQFEKTDFSFIDFHWAPFRWLATPTCPARTTRMMSILSPLEQTQAGRSSNNIFIWIHPLDVICSDFTYICIISAFLLDHVIFFDCGMHAREWISSATCLYLIQVIGSAVQPVSTLSRWLDQQCNMFQPYPGGCISSATCFYLIQVIGSAVQPASTLSG